MTSRHLHELFARIGPVVGAKVIKDANGNCIMGIVEMSCAEDVEEILATKDRISIGGQRPYIWKVADEHTLATLIKAKDNGTHLEQYKGRWYLFEVSGDLLRWCRVLTKKEADTFYGQDLNTPRI